MPTNNVHKLVHMFMYITHIHCIYLIYRYVVPWFKVGLMFVFLSVLSGHLQMLDVLITVFAPHFTSCEVHGL